MLKQLMKETILLYILWQMLYEKNVLWISMLLQSMKKRSHSNVNLMATVLLSNELPCFFNTWSKEANQIWLLGNSFIKKKPINYHLSSIHEGKRPLKCKTCGYDCSQKGDLKEHEKSFHNGKKPFKFKICDYSCSHRNYLRIYIESVHKGRVYLLYLKTKTESTC